MTEPTYKEVALRRLSVTLLVHPSGPRQRAVFRVRADRADQRANAVAKARLRHGDAPLAWLHFDGTIEDL